MNILGLVYIRDHLSSVLSAIDDPRLDIEQTMAEVADKTRQALAIVNAMLQPFYDAHPEG